MFNLILKIIQSSLKSYIIKFPIDFMKDKLFVSVIGYNFLEN